MLGNAEVSAGASATSGSCAELWSAAFDTCWCAGGAGDGAEAASWGEFENGDARDTGSALSFAAGRALLVECLYLLGLPGFVPVIMCENMSAGEVSEMCLADVWLDHVHNVAVSSTWLCLCWFVLGKENPEEILEASGGRATAHIKKWACFCALCEATAYSSNHCE